MHSRRPSPPAGEIRPGVSRDVTNFALVAFGLAVASTTAATQSFTVLTTVDPR